MMENCRSTRIHRFKSVTCGTRVANFFKNREKPDENSRKYVKSNRLHFSREREKGLKKG